MLVTADHSSHAAFAPAADVWHWRLDARCRGQAETFLNEESWPWARVVCSRCPVRDDCLDDALAFGDVHDFRAGQTPKELNATFKAVGRRGVGRCCEVCQGSFLARSPRVKACPSCRRNG